MERPSAKGHEDGSHLLGLSVPYRVAAVNEKLVPTWKHLRYQADFFQKKLYPPVSGAAL
jgi:hypothetical protein